MFGPTDSDVLWLTLTNIALGGVTVVCLLVVGLIVFREVIARARKRVTVPIYNDDHTFNLYDLGVTMADGGVRVNEQLLPKGKDGSSLGDESNIIRSEN